MLLSLTSSSYFLTLVRACRSDPTENDSVEGLRPNARGPGLVTFGVSNLHFISILRNFSLQMQHQVERPITMDAGSTYWLLFWEAAHSYQLTGVCLKGPSMERDDISNKKVQIASSTLLFTLTFYWPSFS